MATQQPLPPRIVSDNTGYGSANVVTGLTPSTTDLDLRELFRKLWRRKMVLIGTMLVILAGTSVILNQMVPRYTAKAQVLIDPRQNNLIDIKAVISGLPGDTETIQSEIQILKSRSLAQKVIKRLKLYQYIEFNPPPKPPPVWSKYLSLDYILPDDLKNLLFPPQKQVVVSEEEKQNRLRVSIINKFLRKLQLSQKGRSRVIEIQFESTDPKTAKLATNTLADLYIVDQLEAKFEATKRASEWLNERVTKLRKSVTASERAVESFRKKYGLIESKGMTLASQQISELNSQLILARIKRAEAEARLHQVERLMKSRNGVDSAAEVLSSNLIQGLKAEEARSQRRAAELAQEFGNKHPRMINIRAEIRDHRRKIAIEVRKVIQNLRNEVNVSRIRENSLRSSLGKLEMRVADLNTNEVQLRSLQREANANRLLYEIFLGRFKETTQQNDIQNADARVISYADTPSGKSYPKSKLIMIAAFVGSLFLGVALVLMIEQLDQGFRSMGQVEQTLGVPALGLVPSVGGPKKIVGEPFDYIIDKPISAYGESIRSLYTSILLSDVDNPPKSVLVTSSHPNEGKTSLAISLARLVATQGNKKVVIIDADLRRPQLYKKLNLSASPGLVEFLAGEAKLEDVLQKDLKSNAIVITAGGAPNNPTDVLASDHMKSLLDRLVKANDLVIIDSPPVLAVSDPRILARLADKTVYAVRWIETRRETVMLGLKQIMDTGASLAGVVLTMVNVRKHARYGYGDSGSYYGSHKKYYTG